MSQEYQKVHEEKKETAAGEQTELLDITALVDAAWGGVKRYWVWLLVILSVSASLGWFWASWTYSPTYTASTTFVINTNTASVYSQTYYNKTTAAQFSKTFPYIISNSALQHLIEEDLGVSEIPGTIDAVAMEGTNLITISATAADGQTAYDILQSVLENYPTVARRVIGNTSMTVLEEGGVPRTPNQYCNNKNKAKRGLLAGAAVCAVWMGLYAVRRRTIRREEDLKALLNIRSLASVGKVQFKKTRLTRKNLILLDNARVSNRFTESFRTIRTRIERVMNESGSKVFLVSSADMGEGKTTVAVNLAIAMAQKGKRVVLLDLDLRNPSVMRAFGRREKRSGIAEVLLGKAKLQDVMEVYGELPLQIIPGGKPIQLTARLLSGQYLQNLIWGLRVQADVVILDTPPSGLLFDAAQIAKYADEGIFVVRQDYSSVDRIKEGIEMLTDAQLHITGCILNYAESGIIGYGSYGYGKYGKYGYSE